MNAHAVLRIRAAFVLALQFNSEN